MVRINYIIKIELYQVIIYLANLSIKLIKLLIMPDKGPNLLLTLYNILTSSNFNPPITERIARYTNGDKINATIKYNFVCGNVKKTAPIAIEAIIIFPN